MSIFDDHISNESMRKFTDKLILKDYTVSNSGCTLIPKNTALSQKKRYPFLYSGTPKIPAGTFRETMSIFKGIFGSHATTIATKYDKFVKEISAMKLHHLDYNGKTYYQVNREVKRVLKYKVEHN